MRSSNGDGQHDEVYFLVESWMVNSAGTIEDRRSRRSVVMGDVNNQDNPPRIQAGSAGNRGGLRTRDPFPKIQDRIIHQLSRSRL